MILEGVGALRKELRRYLSYSIFVEVPYEECLQRGVEKDRVTGKSVEELTSLWTNWLAHDILYFDRDDPQSFANAIISGKDNFQKQLSHVG